MRALVTGGGGFAGLHLIRRLLAERDVEVAAGVPDGRAPDRAIEGAAAARLRWLPLDVTSASSVREALEAWRPERIYHLAGQSSVGRSFADPLGTWEVNATGTLRLLEAARELAPAGTRVLVVSSAEIYGAVPEDEQPIREERAPRPVTPYGASKLGAEAVALSAAAGGLHVVIARGFNHAGPGQDDRFLLPNLARQLVAAGGPTRPRVADAAAPDQLRVGNLEARRDFLDVRDVVRAYATLLERGERGGIYNVCSGEAPHLSDLVRELVAASGTGARIVTDPDRIRPVDIPMLRGDASRLRALGWEPEIPLARTLRDLLAAAEEP